MRAIASKDMCSYSNVTMLTIASKDMCGLLMFFTVSILELHQQWIIQSINKQNGSNQ